MECSEQTRKSTKDVPPEKMASKYCIYLVKCRIYPSKSEHLYLKIAIGPRGVASSSISKSTNDGNLLSTRDVMVGASAASAQLR